MKELKGFTRNGCIHTPTKELAEKVVDILHNAGYTWARSLSLKKQLNFEYGEEHCYRLVNKLYPYISYSSKPFYEGKGYSIISAEEFIKLNSLKREDVYLELVDSKTCKEIARILENSGESVYCESLNWLKSGNMSNYPLLYYTDNMWIRTNEVKERVKITIEELKQLVGFKEMNTFKIGDRVKVINGGSGAFCANDTIGTIISRGEVDFDNYNGEYRGTIAPIYVKCDDGRYWGLCDGYKLEHIKTKQTMKNQYIKCLSPEHGKRIIKYFESKGITNDKGLRGSLINHYYGSYDGLTMTYYGNLPEDGIEIFLPEETKEESYTITRKALSEIYPLVNGCSKWRKTIEAILNTNFFAEEFTITKERVLEAYSEANPKQLEWLNKYLPKPRVVRVVETSTWVLADRTGAINRTQFYKTKSSAEISAKGFDNYIYPVELRGTYEVFE